jgi:uncharacterized membrane protein
VAINPHVRRATGRQRGCLRVDLRPWPIRPDQAAAEDLGACSTVNAHASIGGLSIGLHDSAMSADSPTSMPAQELPPVRTVEPTRVFAWLAGGMRDLSACKGVSLLHGLVVVILSYLVLATTLLRWELVIIAVSCFVFVGPFLATGLYAVSRALQNGARPTMTVVIHAWRDASHCLFRFGFLLVFIGGWWVGLSLFLFYFFVNVRIDDPMDFLRYVLTQQDQLFALWIILGGLYAAVTFAITVVTMPLLADRDVNSRIAVQTSIRAVSENPVTMVGWAMVIMILTVISFVTGMLGFLVLYPLMGHASWHVYRDLVDVSKLPHYASQE